MHHLWMLSVLLHILAAITWFGGILFLVLVVVPWLRRGDRAKAAAFLMETGTPFRKVGWICFALVLATGTFNLWYRGVRLGDFVDPAWLGSPFGKAVVIKLGLFAVTLVVSGVHDFYLGPRASIAVEQDPGSAEAERLRKLASKLGRWTALLALALVWVGVLIVRGGWPW